MVLAMRAAILMEQNKERESLFGEMDLHMRETFNTTTLAELVIMLGLMVDSLWVPGRQTRWKVEGFSLGLMVENMRENM